jgi:hypothetical protein
MQDLGFTTQAEQLLHCASQTIGRADWVGNWDIDEALVMGPPLIMHGIDAAVDWRDAVTATRNATISARTSSRSARNVAKRLGEGNNLKRFSKNGPPSLRIDTATPAAAAAAAGKSAQVNALNNLLVGMADNVTGITIPRFHTASTLLHQYPGEDELEFTQYMSQFGMDHNGKSMWRPCHHSYPIPLAGHHLMVAVGPGEEARPLGNVVTPDGAPLPIPSQIDGSTGNTAQFKCSSCQHHNGKYLEIVDEICADHFGGTEALTAQKFLDSLVKVQKGKNTVKCLPHRGLHVPLACPHHVIHWDRFTNHLSLAEIGDVRSVDLSLAALVGLRYGGKEEMDNAMHGLTMPAFAVPMRLNHYFGRSHSECKWRGKVHSEHGSIFEGDQRKLLLRRRCAKEEEQTAQQKEGRPGSSKRDPRKFVATDHTIGNAKHVQTIHDKINELFGVAGTKVTHDEKVAFRKMLEKES